MYHYTANITPRGGGIWNLAQTPQKVWCLKGCFYQHHDLSGVLAKHHGKIVVVESNTTIFPNTTDKQHGHLNPLTSTSPPHLMVRAYSS